MLKSLDTCSQPFLSLFPVVPNDFLQLRIILASVLKIKIRCSGEYIFVILFVFSYILGILSRVAGSSYSVTYARYLDQILADV